MPELPEVETYRKQLEKSLKGKSIKDVIVHPDKLVFSGKSPAFIKKAFIGAKVKKCNRRGKYIWFELGSKIWPVFHLGMTGSYVIADQLPEKSVKAIKLILEMDDGTIMYFKDPRRFGKILLLENPVEKKPLSQLGPDVLSELPSVKLMTDSLLKHKAPVKTVLMDQSLFAGIGNWMADEILFQSGISPLRFANTLSSAEVKKLHSKIKSVTKHSVKVNADPDRYPRSWLFTHRWGKKAGKVSTGQDIKHDVVGGRSTAWVPKKQK